MAVLHADKGRAKIREAISLSERAKSTTQLLQALSVGSSFYMELREPDEAGTHAENVSTLGDEAQLPDSVEVSVYQGWAMAEQGRTDKGIALIRGALDSLARLGGKPYMAVCLRALSEAQARAGELEKALASVEHAFSVVGQMRIYLLGVVWWRGELHLRLADVKKAADDFRETIATARRIGSKAYELRATTSLARLLRDTNRCDEARVKLAEIYDWFTEGFQTADLKEAKALLDQLNQ